jgi:hypothetical protein
MASEKEDGQIHRMLAEQLSLLSGAVERGFDSIRGDLRQLRTDFTETARADRDHFAGDVIRLHNRMDAHLRDDHHVNSSPRHPAVESDPHLPRGVETTRRWVTFALELGALAGGCMAIMYFLYRAAEAGLFK